jgi:hypothetical protein
MPRLVLAATPRPDAHACLPEYQAELIVAASTGAAELACALWRMECLTPRLSKRCCSDRYLGANQSPEHPSDVMDRMRSFLVQAEESGSSASVSLRQFRSLRSLFASQSRRANAT